MRRQIVCQRRHQRARQHIGSRKREHHRLGERPEQITGDAAEPEHRHESDANAEQRDGRRHHDLLRAIENGGLDLLALLEMPVDVLDGDGGVVDQDADGERQTAERHDVDGLAQQRKAGQRRQDRERDRERDDQGRAPAAKEQQDHHPGQRCRDHAFLDDAGHRVGNENRLIAHRRQLQAARKRLRNRRQQVLDAVDDVQRRTCARLHDGQQHGAGAVDVNGVDLRRAAVMHVGDVAHIDDGAVDGFHGKIVEGFDRFRRVVQVDGIFVGADLLGSDRRDQVLQRERVDDVVRGNAVLMQSLLIEIGLDLAHLAAERKRQGSPRNRCQCRADEIQRRHRRSGFRTSGRLKGQAAESARSRH